VVIQHQDACLALRPLKCRVLDPVETDRNPQRRTAGAVRDLALGVDRSDRGMLLSLRLVDDHTGTLVQPLLFSGWCVALLAAPDQVTDLRVTESFHEDGEVPRTYGELIRTVALDTPGVSLKLVRDMATGKVSRFVDDTEFVFSASPG
jgi:hypothetical protein